MIGLHRAKELAFFGDVISAEEARDLGIVNKLVPHTQLDDEVASWAGRLAAQHPIALAQTKRMLNRSLELSMGQALEEEGAAQTVNLGTRDTGEAIAAFLEKREPDYQGR
jgi:2-(1,2-epoxy-1,2-dihydrophenyl)acetyl-CoA isomerase